MRTYVIYKLGPKNWAVELRNRELEGFPEVRTQVGSRMSRKEAVAVARLLAGHRHKCIIEK